MTIFINQTTVNLKRLVKCDTVHLDGSIFQLLNIVKNVTSLKLYKPF